MCPLMEFERYDREVGGEPTGTGSPPISSGPARSANTAVAKRRSPGVGVVDHAVASRGPRIRVVVNSTSIHVPRIRIVACSSGRSPSRIGVIRDLSGSVAPRVRIVYSPAPYSPNIGVVIIGVIIILCQGALCRAERGKKNQCGREGSVNCHRNVL